MELKRVLEGITTSETHGELGREIAGLAYDSRCVEPGGLFAALPGETHDGNKFVPQAVEAGACAVLSEHAPAADCPATWVQVESARRALAQVSANFYRHPARDVRVIGITGTNGKTTTGYLLQSILEAAGVKAGLFGTVTHRTATGEVAAINTTPESLDLQRFLAEWREAGAAWVVMEVSSHGLAYDRVYGVPYAAAVFTNLAGDHLDYHKTMENYFAAKQKLFTGLGAEPPGVAVLNVDDPYGQRLVAQSESRVVTYGVQNEKVDVAPEKTELSLEGISFTLKTPEGTVEINSALVGRSNLCNLVAAGAVGYALGFSAETIASGLANLRRVPGRFERVDAGQPFTVIIDFAHTDLAFTNLLNTARELARNRVIIVFGSGGDRDRTKRPVMGEIAGRLADYVILTTDNPRTEDPARILSDTVVGVQKANGNYEVVEDREQAFGRAFEMAQEGDMVLLAGKGHQQTQIFAGREEPWSEREAAQRALARLGYGRK